MGDGGLLGQLWLWVEQWGVNGRSLSANIKEKLIGNEDKELVLVTQLPPEVETTIEVTATSFIKGFNPEKAYGKAEII